MSPSSQTRQPDQRILVACMGDSRLQDGGFGAEVARGLVAKALPPAAVLKYFGTRAVDLTYALLDSYQMTILVDACARGGKPGTLYMIAPSPIESNWPGDIPGSLGADGINPLKVLHLVKAMGWAASRILIVGCEPAKLNANDEEPVGLGRPVRRP